MGIRGWPPYPRSLLSNFEDSELGQLEGRESKHSCRAFPGIVGGSDRVSFV